MDMAAVTFRDLPAELCDDLPGDPADWAVLALDGPEPVLLVAGPDAAGGITILAVTETWIELLWPLGSGAVDGESADAGSGRNRVDLVATGDGRALALIPGEGLIRLDPLAGDEGLRARRLRPGRGGAPDRIFALQDTVTGLWRRSDGRTLLAPLDADGKRIAGADRAGPGLQPGQRVGLILRDGAGRDVVTVDDHRTGFHLWQDTGPGNDGTAGWVQLTGDGAARHAMNAGVVAAALWGDRIVLATGRTTAVRQALPGLPVAAELIAVDQGGMLRIMAGELRISARGLMVPELSAGAITTLGLGIGQVAHLAVDATGRLIVALRGHDGIGRLLAIAPDGTVIPLATPCPTVLALVAAPAAGAGLAAVVAG